MPGSEMQVFSAALETAPALVETGLGSDAEVEVLPGVVVDPWVAYRWLIGELPTDALGEKPTHTSTWYVAPVIHAYRQHDRALRSYIYGPGKTDALVALARARIHLTENGWHLPELPDGVTRTLDEPLGWLGWRVDDSGALVKVEPATDQAFTPVEVEFDPARPDPTEGEP